MHSACRFIVVPLCIASGEPPLESGESDFVRDPQALPVVLEDPDGTEIVDFESPCLTWAQFPNGLQRGKCEASWSGEDCVSSLPWELCLAIGSESDKTSRECPDAPIAIERALDEAPPVRLHNALESR